VVTIWGDSDTVVIYDDFAEKIEHLLPNRREYFVKDSGHLPHMENTQQFEAILLEVLDLKQPNATKGSLLKTDTQNKSERGSLH
jgi:pimeloyl-ACP methyl ester carboxylesterase